MRTDAFDYPLPPELIAQSPPTPRGTSRLLLVDRSTGQIQPTRFESIASFLKPGDLLVFNNSRVIPARLRGRRPETGGRVEVLLLEPADPTTWWAMVRPGKRLRIGAHILLPDGEDPSLPVQVLEKNAEGHCRLGFPPGLDPVEYAEAHGEMPLPPYIQRDQPEPADRERYQTVYAREPGSVAAPTAGLHFSADKLAELDRAGIQRCEVTLHVGVGTFAPVKAERLEDHVMHAERFTIPAASAAAIRQAKMERRRVIAVGTTSLRVLESVARDRGEVVEGPGRTDLFLWPPADFAVVDGLLTNFHLPRSTLLMLVCAFAAPGATSGCQLVLEAYRTAVAQRFRFFSYGDAMLLT